ncbi:MAG: diguanylate cyclase [Alphaproteobacteria bacterium]|nr:diguanylate cyclase [Alphaproteobacteria bacterium]
MDRRRARKGTSIGTLLRHICGPIWSHDFVEAAEAGHMLARALSSPDYGNLSIRLNPLPHRGAVIAVSPATSDTSDSIAEFQLLEAMQSLSEGVCLYDAEDRLVMCNERCQEFFPEVADLLRPGTTFEALCRAEVGRGGIADDRPSHAVVAERLERHRDPGEPFEQCLADGRWILISEHRTLDGGVIAVFTDITLLRQREQALEDSEATLRSFVLNVPGIVFRRTRHSDGGFSFPVLDGRVEEFSGYKPDDFRADPSLILEITHPEDRQSYRLAYDRSANQMTPVDLRYRWVYRDSDQVRWLRTMARPRRGPGEEIHWDGLVIDISAQVEAEKQLLFHSSYDSVTGLPNRQLFTDRLDQVLGRAGRYGEIVALLMLDLDGFKYVNDTLGHDAGDELLKYVAELLKKTTRDSDTVCRLGGDEFAVILPTIKEDRDAAIVALNIQRALTEPIALGGGARSPSP